VAKKRVIKNKAVFTFQIIGFITEHNKLGAKIDEMLHQRLLKSSIRKQFKKGQTRLRSTNIDRKRKIDKRHTIASKGKGTYVV
jgi:hypothetical protein